MLYALRITQSPKRITKRGLYDLFLRIGDSHPRVLSVAALWESVSEGAEREPQADHKKEVFTTSFCVY